MRANFTVSLDLIAMGKRKKLSKEERQDFQDMIYQILDGAASVGQLDLEDDDFRLESLRVE